jgi:hypothetical protein
MLILCVLQTDPMHGYAIVQRIRQLSSDVLQVEEGTMQAEIEQGRLAARLDAPQDWWGGSPDVREWDWRNGSRTSMDESIVGPIMQNYVVDFAVASQSFPASSPPPASCYI